MDNRLLARLAGVTRAVTPLAAVTPVSFDAAQFRAGDTVRGQVLARLADGSFRVAIETKIETNTVRLALTGDHQPGDAVELRAVSRDGRIRLEVSNAPRAAGDSRVSGTGRLIATLLRDAGNATPPRAQAILDAATGDAAAIAAPLARAVEESGLFYESHQARWVQGDYPLDALRQEPQAKHLQVADSAPAAQKHAVEGSPRAPVAIGTSGGVEDTDHPVDSRAQNKLASTPPQAEERGPEIVTRELQPLVRQQLETLETRQFAWLGEIWPGQPLRWEIADDRAHGTEHDDPRAWATRLALTLPLLGDVSADLTLAASGLRITLTAASTAVRSSMQDAAPELHAHLRDAGVDVAGITIKRHESAT